MVFRRLCIAVLIAVLTGCATQPVGKRDLLSFLQDGKTSRVEAILTLGEPSRSLEGGRIVTYRLNEDEGGYTILPPYAEGPSFKRSLVLVFDDKGTLRRHSLVKLRPIQ